MALASTRRLDLQQLNNADGFVIRWHYSLCAHPIMTGMMIGGLWATPRMSPSHLLFAGVNTAWMLGAIKHLEEPQLEELIGERYTEYLKMVSRYVPPLCPFTGCPNNSGGGGCPFTSRNQEQKKSFAPSLFPCPRAC